MVSDLHVQSDQARTYNVFSDVQVGHFPGLSLGGDLGEKVSLSWLTSPYFELRVKFKCIEHIGKFKIWTKTSP